MEDKNNDKQASYNPDDIRHEYSAVVGFHGSLVNSRFTIAGLYVAAIGFLGGAVLANDVSWITRAGGSALACWLTFSLWILELRSRALFTNLARRGIQIEHEYWNLIGDRWFDGFFSRQFKEPPNHDHMNEALARRMEPDRPRFGWSKRPIPKSVSKFVSHSMGLDLLYAGSGFFWLLLLITSIVNICITTP